MALRYVDSWDHYSTGQITRKWNAASGLVTVKPGAGRNGTSSLHIGSQNSAVLKTIDPQPTWVVGFAVNFTSFGTQPSVFFQFLDAGSIQLQLRINGDGTLQVLRNFHPVTSGTSVQAMSIGTYYYVEFKATFSTSIGAGTCKVDVDGVNWVTVATGESTQATVNASANGWNLGYPNPTDFGPVDFDDFYCCDGTGSVNKDFLGDVMIQPYYPAGAGASTTWTPTPGANWQNVDEHSPDDDASFNKTGVVANLDLYALDQMAGTAPTIFGVQWNAQLRKNDASIYGLNRAVRSGTTVFLGSALLTPNTTYRNYTEVLELNPDTGTAWTKTTFNAMQAGLKLISAV